MENKEIINTVKGLIDVQDEDLGELERYFDVIVYRNMTNGREIEHLLDLVLGMFPTKETLELLNNYNVTIKKEIFIEK